MCKIQNFLLQVPWYAEGFVIVEVSPIGLVTPERDELEQQHTDLCLIRNLVLPMLLLSKHLGQDPWSQT